MNGLPLLPDELVQEAHMASENGTWRPAHVVPGHVWFETPADDGPLRFLVLDTPAGPKGTMFEYQAMQYKMNDITMDDLGIYLWHLMSETIDIKRAIRSNLLDLLPESFDLSVPSDSQRFTGLVRAIRQRLGFGGNVEDIYTDLGKSFTKAEINWALWFVKNSATVDDSQLPASSAEHGFSETEPGIDPLADTGALPVVERAEPTPSIKRWHRPQTTRRMAASEGWKIMSGDDVDAAREAVRSWIEYRLKDHFRIADGRATEYVSRLGDDFIDRAIKKAKKTKRGY